MVSALEAHPQAVSFWMTGYLANTAPSGKGDTRAKQRVGRGNSKRQTPSCRYSSAVDSNCCAALRGRGPVSVVSAISLPTRHIRSHVGPHLRPSQESCPRESKVGTGRIRLDKLGVTGSSPVPPIADRNPACCAGHDDFDRLSSFDPGAGGRRRRSRHRRGGMILAGRPPKSLGMAAP
jgi:hypothetical protein